MYSYFQMTLQPQFYTECKPRQYDEVPLEGEAEFSDLTAQVGGDESTKEGKVVKVVERGQWNNQTEFFLSCLAYAGIFIFIIYSNGFCSFLVYH